MTKSKLTLIVDGNWLLMSRLSVLRNKFSDDIELNHQLKLLMIKSINVVLRTFPTIDNVIFIADGGSWRNKINVPFESILSYDEIKTIFENHNINIKEHSTSEIPLLLESLSKDDDELKLMEYKATRVKDDDFNWDLLFTSYEDFMNTLQHTGITCCRENGMEGDDWCYHWSRFLNENETNVIIWTKDKDLTQLVQITPNKCFTVWWNKDNGLYIPTRDDEDDFNWLFNMEYAENNRLLSSITDNVDKITEIDPKAIVIDKIIRGDASDNILPIVTRKSKTNNTKVFRVSQNDIDKNLDYNDDKQVYKYITDLLNNKKYKNRVDKNAKQVFEHFKYNRQLVALEEEYFPENVKEIMENHHEYNINKNCTEAENIIQAESNGLYNILNII